MYESLSPLIFTPSLPSPPPSTMATNKTILQLLQELKAITRTWYDDAIDGKIDEIMAVVNLPSPVTATVSPTRTPTEVEEFAQTVCQYCVEKYQEVLYIDDEMKRCRKCFKIDKSKLIKVSELSEEAKRAMYMQVFERATLIVADRPDPARPVCIKCLIHGKRKSYYNEIGCPICCETMEEHFNDPYYSIHGMTVDKVRELLAQTESIRPFVDDEEVDMPEDVIDAMVEYHNEYLADLKAGK